MRNALRILWWKQNSKLNVLRGSYTTWNFQGNLIARSEGIYSIYIYIYIYGQYFTTRNSVSHVAYNFRTRCSILLSWCYHPILQHTAISDEWGNKLVVFQSFAFYWFKFYSGMLNDIHLIPKWRPIDSFVCMLISPLCLIFSSKFFCFLYMMTRPRGLINMQTKE